MKPKVSISMSEQETHINFCPAEMGKECEVYTTVPSMMKHLEKMVNKYPEDCTLVCDDQYSYTVRLPFKLVKPRNPKHMTEEQRAQMADRIRETMFKPR